MQSKGEDSQERSTSILDAQQLSAVCESRLFEGISTNEASAMLRCLHAHVCHAQKGSAVLRQGETVREVGLLLSGDLLLVKEDFWGARSLVSRIGRSGVFAEAVACLPDATSEVTVEAASDAEILFMDMGHIMSPCSANCPFHVRLMQNLLAVVSRRAMLLVEKIGHVAKRTTREKLLSYFSSQALSAHDAEFSLAFSRQQLADYLFVDRSAMSRELSAMVRDGLIEISGKRVRLLKEAPDCL